MHKNFRLVGNFLLSPRAIRASIFLHVKAPDYGGCGPLPGLRLPGDCNSGGLGLSGPWPERGAAVSGELRFLPAFAKGGSSDLSVSKVRRPSGRRQAGCGGPLGGWLVRSGRSSRDPGTESFFGSGPSGTGGRVALQIPVFGWEVSVVLRPCTFRRWPLPFPRVGEPASSGPAASSRSCRTVSPAKEGTRQGADQARKATAPAAAFRRLPDGRHASRRRPCGDGPSGPRRVPETPLPPRRGSASQGRCGWTPEVEWKEPVGPARVSSLPSGRSAFSLRCIGHARPGIRARMLIKTSPAAAITPSWIQLLRRRVVPSLPGYAATGVSPAAPGASLITAADSPLQPKFCGRDPKSHQMWPPDLTVESRTASFETRCRAALLRMRPGFTPHGEELAQAGVSNHVMPAL